MSYHLFSVKSKSKRRRVSWRIVCVERECCVQTIIVQFQKAINNVLPLMGTFPKLLCFFLLLPSLRKIFFLQSLKFIVFCILKPPETVRSFRGKCGEGKKTSTENVPTTKNYSNECKRKSNKFSSGRSFRNVSSKRKVLAQDEWWCAIAVEAKATSVNKPLALLEAPENIVAWKSPRLNFPQKAWNIHDEIPHRMKVHGT